MAKKKMTYLAAVRMKLTMSIFSLAARHHFARLCDIRVVPVDKIAKLGASFGFDRGRFNLFFEIPA
jgi:hypothetical protein